MAGFGFKVDNFKGMLPLLDARKLPSGHSPSTYNLDLKGTDLMVFNAPANLGLVADNTLKQRSVFAYNSKQMFVFSADVNAGFGPIRYADKNDNKVYIDSGFVAYPVYTTKNMGIPISPTSDYFGPPVAYRKLGVPLAPGNPILTVAAVANGQVNGVGAGSTTLADGITVVTDAVVLTLAAPHGLTSGDRVELNGFDWSYFNNSFVIDIEWDVIPESTTRFILRGLVYSDISPGVDQNGDPEPSTPGTGTWRQEFNALEYEDRVYLYTLLTDTGEEGPPSLPSEMITIGFGQAVTITTPTAVVVDDVIVAKKRIYRSIPDSKGAADYYFVAEIPITQSQYIDTLDTIALGERMPSLEWFPPPPGLRGLIALPNGVMMGFVDNTIYQSEPYQPHAWPDSYTKQVDTKIVSIASFGQQVVVGTEENPYLATLTDPLSLTFKKLGTVEPCLFRRSMASLGYAVMYISPNGLILVTSSGTRNVLKGVWDDESWKYLVTSGLAYNDSFANVHNEKYYLTMVGNALSTTYIFDPSESPLQISGLSSHNYTGATVDRDEDKLFFLGQQTGPSGPAIFEHDPVTVNPVLGFWESETFVMPLPVNMGICQVFFKAASLNLINARFYADGNYKYGKIVTDQEPFRLPSGFLAREWRVEFDTDTPIQAIFVAETVDDLRGAFARR